MKSPILRWLSRGLLLVLVAVACLAAYGATRPREHEISRTIELDRSPAEVFAILEDARAFPCWRSEVATVEIVAESPRRFVEHTDDGEITFVVEERVADRRLVVRIADDDLPWGGAWTYELVPTGSGTALTITERGFVDNVILRGLVAVFTDPATSMTRVQNDLQRYEVCD